MVEGDDELGEDEGEATAGEEAAFAADWDGRATAADGVPARPLQLSRGLACGLLLLDETDRQNGGSGTCSTRTATATAWCYAARSGGDGDICGWCGRRPMSQTTITEALAELKTIDKRVQKKQEFVQAC